MARNSTRPTLAPRAVLRRIAFGGGGRLLERLHLATPALRAYERWLARKAPAIPERGSDGLPMPPAPLQVLVAGYATPGFEQEGAEAAESIRTILRRAGGDITECRAVLDFGVGCARVARHWSAIDGPEFHACDYNERLVRWCQESLPFLQTVRNELEPPLPYPDGRFDLVYAYSVFTHLTEALQHRWIAELARVVAPGGRIMFTTHGQTLRHTLEPELQARFDQGRLAVRFADTAGSNLCSAFHPERWVRDHLLGELEVLDFQAGGGPGLGVHDVWTVRR
jgi:SAM-dependent methyltransferase